MVQKYGFLLMILSGFFVGLSQASDKQDGSGDKSLSRTTAGVKKACNVLTAKNPLGVKRAIKKNTTKAREAESIGKMLFCYSTEFGRSQMGSRKELPGLKERNLARIELREDKNVPYQLSTKKGSLFGEGSSYGFKTEKDFLTALAVVQENEKLAKELEGYKAALTVMRESYLRIREQNWKQARDVVALNRELNNKGDSDKPGDLIGD